MRVAMANVGSTVSSYGFRILGALVRRDFPKTSLHFVVVRNLRNLISIIKTDVSSRLTDADVDSIADELSQAEVIGLASMSEYAQQVKDIIAAIRKKNPRAYIVWGGIHAMSDPDDAIEHADAVCTSEGEFVFPELLRRIRDGEDFKDIGNFWFRDQDDIQKNAYVPLLTPDELTQLPMPVYGENEFIYKAGTNAFETLTDEDYLDLDALSYNTVWSRGCPFRCSYCGNTVLLAIDKGYGKIRHSTVDHVIEETKTALRRFPHISVVAFHDDCFISLPEDVLREFAQKWRQRIGLPIVIHGVTPAHIRKEKVEILLEAGLNRVRMGVQSGSDRLLKFYKRPNRPGLIKQSTDILGEYSKLMMPPIYDMIFDNPIETKSDIDDSLRLLYDMPRPYVLNIFSLRHIPNSELGKQLAELDVDVEGIDKDYNAVMPTFANVLMYITALIRLPRPVFEYLLKFAKPYRQSAHVFGFLILPLRAVYMAKRAYYHLIWKDFSIILGRLGRVMWRAGFLKSTREAPNGFIKSAPKPLVAESTLPSD